MSMSYAKSEKPIELVVAFGNLCSERPEVVLDCTDALDRTKQSFADECDINNIVSRYAETGYLPPTRGEPQFGECPTVQLKDALDAVKRAREEYDNLSPELHKRFENFDHYLNVLSLHQENPDVFHQVLNMGASHDDSATQDVEEKPKQKESKSDSSKDD